jgi:hypothetical protein
MGSCGADDVINVDAGAGTIDNNPVAMHLGYYDI